jgi:DNA helicase-2/ATP-dependent DNA helicase PcrA
MSNLNEFQLKFCQDPNRALRLLAPAGSGKTHSLLMRCLTQMQDAAVGKSRLPRFLFFTFTRAARDELRNRLKQDPALQSLQSQVQITTLNSWGFRRLRERMHNTRMITAKVELYTCVLNQLQPVWQRHEPIRAALTNAFTKNRVANLLMGLMDSLKSLGFRHQRDHDLSAFLRHADWLKELGLEIHLAKAVKQLHDAEILQGNGEAAFPEFCSVFMPFWRDACELLRQSATLTLEDQKYFALLDLLDRKDENPHTTGIHRVDHVLVDEFQDINKLDLDLLLAIAEANKCPLTLAGDDDQAIFEWRGASPEFILHPEVHLGTPYDTHVLGINYRSPRNIVEHAQKLIQHNTRRVPKDVRAASNERAQLRVKHAAKLADTVEHVVSEVKARLAEGKFEKIAIIGRKRSQIIPYQIAFAAEDIPFYAAEDLQVFLSDAFLELKEMLAIKVRSTQPAMFGFDPTNDLITLCDKVKKYPLKKDERTRLLNHVRATRPKNLQEANQVLLQYTGTLKGSNQDGKKAIEFARSIQALLKARTVADTLEQISLEFEGLQKDYGKAMEDIFFTDPPFLYLGAYAEPYGEDFEKFHQDIERAMTTLARVTDDSNEDDDPAPPWKVPLHLLTALRAKGKEYDAVYLLDVNDGIWPSKLATTPAQLEGERRVFYVAFTRVKKSITLMVNDKILGEPAAPSPYLGEMGLEIFPSGD